MKHRPTRVLVVDDSNFVREVLTQALQKVDSLDVVGSARDPYEASDLLMRLQPDVMTLDMEMPGMHGTEFLRQLLPQWPIPVIMVSAHTARGTLLARDALSAGAVEVVFKPGHLSQAGFQDMMNELVHKIKSATGARMQNPNLKAVQRLRGVPQPADLLRTRYRLIAIGASTGGPQAITTLLRDLPAELPPIIISQHLPVGFSCFFAERLQQETTLITKEAEDGELLRRGHIYIAPCGFQTEVKAVDHELQLRVYRPKENHTYNPSVDVLFHSVAQQVGSNAIGILLTGMGEDGAHGLKSMLEAGAYTVGQDEQSSVVYGMARVARQLGALQTELPLKSIVMDLLKTLGRSA